MWIKTKLSGELNGDTITRVSINEKTNELVFHLTTGASLHEKYSNKTEVKKAHDSIMKQLSKKYIKG